MRCTSFSYVLLCCGSRTPPAHRSARRLATLATLPLARMSDRLHDRSASPPAKPTWRGLASPLLDPRFRRLMWFGICYSVANGSSIAAANLSGEHSQTRTRRKTVARRRVARLQIVLMPRLGRVVDRRGNVGLLVVSWAIVSLGTLCFFLRRGRRQHGGSAMKPTSAGSPMRG